MTPSAQLHINHTVEQTVSIYAVSPLRVPIFLSGARMSTVKNCTGGLGGDRKMRAQQHKKHFPHIT